MGQKNPLFYFVERTEYILIPTKNDLIEELKGKRNIN